MSAYTYKEVRRHLGARFITPRDIMSALPVQYRGSYAKHLPRILVDWCTRGCGILLPSSPDVMSLCDMITRFPAFFGYGDRDMFERILPEEQEFAHTEFTGREHSSHWMAVRWLPNTIGVPYTDLASHVKEDERVPSAVQAAWAIGVYCMVRGEHLCAGLSTRTSSTPTFYSPARLFEHRVAIGASGDVPCGRISLQIPTVSANRLVGQMVIHEQVD